MHAHASSNTTPRSATIPPTMLETMLIQHRPVDLSRPTAIRLTIHPAHFLTPYPLPLRTTISHIIMYIPLQSL